MQTSFHFNSAQDITSEILEKIRSTYKTKPIAIIVEEGNSLLYYSLSDDQKNILDNCLNENTISYISSDESIKRLKKKNGL